MNDVIISSVIDDPARSGLRFRIDIMPDPIHLGPMDWTTRSDDPELFADWESGNWRMVCMLVTPLLVNHNGYVELQDAMEALFADLSGIPFGSCTAWAKDINIHTLITEEPGPALIDEARERVLQLLLVLSGLNLK